MIVMITYDLKQKDKDYNSLYNAIKHLSGNWWHYLESVWLVQTNLTINDCYDKIKIEIDDNDTLFIVDITNQHYQGWLPSKAWQWIKENDK